MKKLILLLLMMAFVRTAAADYNVYRPKITNTYTYYNGICDVYYGNSLLCVAYDGHHRNTQDDCMGIGDTCTFDPPLEITTTSPDSNQSLSCSSSSSGSLARGSNDYQAGIIKSSSTDSKGAYNCNCQSSGGSSGGTAECPDPIPIEVIPQLDGNNISGGGCFICHSGTIIAGCDDNNQLFCSSDGINNDIGYGQGQCTDAGWDIVNCYNAAQYAGYCY